ncbi:MAG: hypothetical protein IJA54_06810 [Tyzzerella sp.]|nr:hypothetical protein [Tyzzerella sp.]
MTNNRRCRVVKARLTESEYKIFQENLLRSGARSCSEYLRDRIILSDNQIIKRERMAGKIGREQLEGQMNVISDIFSVINQYKAGVDKELAVDKLEKDVKKLWQLLKQ